MIPAAWEQHVRGDDGEHVGYLAPAPDDLVVPMTLLGTPLGDPMDRFAAEQTLEEVGLSYLAERWLLRHDDGSEQRVVLVEVDAARAVVANADFALVVGVPENIGTQVEVDLPTDRLRRA